MRHYFDIKQYIYTFQIDVMLLNKVLHLEEEIQVISPDNLVIMVLLLFLLPSQFSVFIGQKNFWR